ncbi:MAG: L-arabinose isomerase [Sphaerochaeta sp.]|nr:L-arabinose isomerase [Sphaerochaeta sp.]
MNALNIWFLTGSQDLYGDDALHQVALHTKQMVEELNASGNLPLVLVVKPVLKSSAEILKTIQHAEADESCAGVVCWMHTFSPAKTWIAGLSILTKPLLQLHTQFNERIPFDTMDMDFMNLNQSAHGDREFGHITARMGLRRTVIAGHWSHEETQQRIGRWMRSAAAVAESRTLVVVRFGDNMRDVAVTDGDKVEAMIQFGWSVPYFGIGDLVDMMASIPNGDINLLIDEYRHSYTLKEGMDEAFFFQQVTEQARIELALEKFLQQNNAMAFSTNFQDLHGMKQLPGLAVQRLMGKGYGFAGEGDWKIAALVRILKRMGEGLSGGSSFMEDYTYHLEKGAMLDLGAHMLEVCPSISKDRPTLEVHPLGIGEREDPARLVFDGAAGPALCASIIDLGHRFRMVISEVETIDSPHAFKRLPVARVLWKPLPDLITASEAWILAGGGHHTAYSSALDTDYLLTYAEMMGIEAVRIGKGTSIHQLRSELRWNEAYWSGHTRV